MENTRVRLPDPTRRMERHLVICLTKRRSRKPAVACVVVGSDGREYGEEAGKCRDIKAWLLQHIKDGPQRYIGPPKATYIEWCHGIVAVASRLNKDNLVKYVKEDWKRPPGGYHYLSELKEEPDTLLENLIGYDPVLSFGMIPDDIESSAMRTARILACCFCKKYLKSDESIPKPEEFQETDSRQIVSRLTDEQRKVVHAVGAVSGDHLVVQALAGTGKTTTMLYAVRQTGFKTILVTYNRHLCDSTRNKRAQLGISEDDCVVHTFHSLANWLWAGASVKDDHSLQNTLRRPRETCKQDLSLYRLLIIDECQDLRELYCELIQMLREHLSAEYKIVLIGDFFQCVYGDMPLYAASSTKYMEDPTE